MSFFTHDEKFKGGGHTLQYIFTSLFDEGKINAITRKYSIYCNSLSAINYSVFIAMTVKE